MTAKIVEGIFCRMPALCAEGGDPTAAQCTTRCAVQGPGSCWRLFEPLSETSIGSINTREEAEAWVLKQSPTFCITPASGGWSLLRRDESGTYVTVGAGNYTRLEEAEAAMRRCIQFGPNADSAPRYYDETGKEIQC